MQEADEPHTEAAACFYPDSIHTPEAFGPGAKLRVAGIRERYSLASEEPAKPVQGNRDVHLGVRVEPPNEIYLQAPVAAQNK